MFYQLDNNYKTSLDETLSQEDLLELITSLKNTLSEYISKLSNPTSIISPIDIICAMDYICDSFDFNSDSETLLFIKNESESLLLLAKLIKNHVITYSLSCNKFNNGCDCYYNPLSDLTGIRNTIIQIHSNANEYLNDINIFEKNIKNIN